MNKSLIDAISEHFNDNAVDKISNQLGESNQKTNEAIQLALPALVGAFASKLNRSPNTMNLITSFLDKDGDGNVMDDILGMFFGQSASSDSSVASQNVQAGDASNFAGLSSIFEMMKGSASGSGNNFFSGILQNLLGSNQHAALGNHIASAANLSREKSTMLVQSLLPYVIKGLKSSFQNTKNESEGVSPSQGLSQQLVNETDSIRERSPELSSLFDMFQDKDGDGSILDNLVGGLFEKR
jgi:hypothetical protein